MIEDVKKAVKKLLESGEIDGFIGLRAQHGHIGPHLFCDKDKLEDLVLGDRDRPGDSRYPLNKQLLRLAGYYPDRKFGILVRGCDERGLRALYAWNQLNPERVVTVGIPCPAELAEYCECSKPYPDDFVCGEKTEAQQPESVRQVESLTHKERFTFWMEQFEKCIKCHGCRDICPMCFCRECSLDDHELIYRGEIPPEAPLFHLVRAVHMAGRCIDCGLCNEACPADIQLRTLYKKVAEIMDVEFGYKTGFSDEKPPLYVIDEMKPTTAESNSPEE